MPWTSTHHSSKPSSKQTDAGRPLSINSRKPNEQSFTGRAGEREVRGINGPMRRFRFLSLIAFFVLLAAACGGETTAGGGGDGGGTAGKEGDDLLQVVKDRGT